MPNEHPAGRADELCQGAGVLTGAASDVEHGVPARDREEVEGKAFVELGRTRHIVQVADE